MAVMFHDGNELPSLPGSRRCRILRGQQPCRSSLHELLLNLMFFHPWESCGLGLNRVYRHGVFPSVLEPCGACSDCCSMASSALKPGHLTACSKAAGGL